MKKSKWNNFKRYYTLDTFYKNKFGRKVAKISLNAGFTCPNIDGTVGRGGCIYCSSLGSGDFAGKESDDLLTQFNDIQKKIQKKWNDTLYIGYFQAHTNTYAPLPVLKVKYETILNEENVIGLAIATRPDAIEEDIMDYLEELSKKTYIQIELGLQTIHPKTSVFINRCHTLECFESCVEKLRKRNIDVVVHIINGLPYETKDMMIETVKYLNALDIQGVKIHMLHILKNTRLEKVYATNPFPVLTKEEYIDIVCDELEYLRPDIVIHRVTGDPDIKNLIAPSWLDKKLCILNEIDKDLERRKTYQGFRLASNNLLDQILAPILHQNDYVIDLTQQYSELLKDYINEAHIYRECNHNLFGKTTLLLTNQLSLDQIHDYIKFLHHRGFILLIQNKPFKKEKYQNLHVTFYEFEQELYIAKIDKSE